MNLEQILVVGFSTGNAVGMILNVKKIPAGWYVVAFAQFCMGAFLVVSGVWKEGLPQFVCLAIALWGSYKWTTERRRSRQLEHGREAKV